MSTEYRNTLDGLLLLNDQNMSDIYPTNLLDDAPVIRALYAQNASQGGTLHKYLRRTTAAGVGFRAIGNGVTNAAEKFEDVALVCKYLDASLTRDVALAQGYRGGLSEYIRKETLASLQAAFAKLEAALFDKAGSTGAYAGLLDFEEYTKLASTQVVLAGDSTVASNRSVWLLRTAENGVSVIAGNEGRVDMEWSDSAPTIVQVAGSDSGVYSAYRVTLGGWFGLQVGSKFDAVRITNLGTVTGTPDTYNKLTDDLISKGISRFPAQRGPNMIVMSRTSLQELQESRTATNPTGAPAPFPNEAFGVPIIVTDLLPEGEDQPSGDD